jgi:hypothetical protein
MQYQRLLNREAKPTTEEIAKIIGKKSYLWIEIHKYIEENYNFTSELVFWTKNYGWTIRYKKGSRTICYFFPEKEAFAVLIVLGKKQAENVDLTRLNTKIKSVFRDTEQLHDGRWLWVRALTKSDVESIKVLLNAKQKLKKEKIK